MKKSVLWRKSITYDCNISFHFFPSEKVDKLRGSNMSKWKIILRELLVFVATVSILPILALLMSREHPLNTLLSGAFREMLYGRIYSEHGPVAVWLRILTPYAFVQALRAWYWSHTSIVARRWAHLYFSVIFFGVCFWSLSEAWNLFYLMYALGDIPGEMGQFMELEGTNILIGIGALFLALYSVLIFLNPSHGGYKSG